MPLIQQDDGNIPQRFWTILTQEHHIVHAGLLTAHRLGESLIPAHLKRALQD